MKLLLTSGGLTNKSIVNALKDLAGRPFSELKLAFIPTASTVEEGDKQWLIQDMVNCSKLGFKIIDIVDFSTLPQDIWQARLEQADILLFGGGNTFHLAYCLKKTGLKKLLYKMLETKVYVGISAGSIIASKSLKFSKSKRLYSTTTGGYKGNAGLGLVDFYIQPHLNSSFFSSIKIDNVQKEAWEVAETVYALDDNSAVKVDADNISVVSEGQWKKFN